ncbi:MAG: hypothetical protein HOG03_05240 [Desulfobacula sp.]|jgi:trimeric autotransporter adhesin|uniref:NHL repeat-containing protein n=1 Tax=Desulfobacula sp. TaxID=2593537 RepID=UPI001DB3F401|nr:hypothetical protein [Desulfobacula sp.]MBT3484618.1 hypothetical protein [Desulfobacula sp.]MBT3803988.1 hypothetical protein [Desulfobacula sp.]MBT4023603.1 hypothetical protein [Desulfobacula sp.]MBT4197729.1 hypothetical protein [Desulfobacula sp.]
MPDNQKGFLLISVIFIMLLLAVSIFSINYYSVTQVRMAGNQTSSIQTSYDLKAIVEQSVWKLTQNPFWRTIETGEDYTFNGTTYTRIVRNADTAPFNYPTSFDDAVTVQVTPKGSSQSFERSFRYYASEFVGIDVDLNDPQGIFKDSSGNLYIANTNNHTILKVDTYGVVTTIAGTGSAGDTGDGGLATSARLDQPRGVFKDNSGDIYIADTKNHKIRRIDMFGDISTVAGTGDSGSSGDGGAAISARLAEPKAIIKDSSGNLYISDTNNDKIRKVNTSGVISTFAGTGSAGSSGDGGAATSAMLNTPRGIYMDSSGNLYIADKGNDKIRKVDTSGDISTIAGTGSSGSSGDGGAATAAQLDEPKGVFKDTTGNLYIADSNNSKIRKVDTSGDISTIAGTGSSGFSGDGSLATSAQINKPQAVLMDTTGELYIADTNNSKIRKVDTSGYILTFVSSSGAGDEGDGGLATLAQLNHPAGIFKDSSGLYIADTNNHKIRKVDPSGIITTIAGTGSSGWTGDGGAATSATLDSPRNMVKSASSGNLYIADTKNHAIRKVDTSGNISTFAGKGDAGYAGEGGPATNAKMNEPSGVLVSGAYLYIADTKNHVIRRVAYSAGLWRIWTYAGTGSSGSTGDGGLATLAKLNEPWAIAQDTSGNLYIADKNNHKIRKINTSGIISTFAGTGSSGYSGDGGLATLAQLKNPVDVFADSSNNIFIVELDGRRIRVVNAGDNKISTLAGTGASGYNKDLPAVETLLNDPEGIAMESAYGATRIFVSDTNNHKIKVLTLKTVYGF